MINIPEVPKPGSPVFFDLIITQMQDVFKKELPWLNHSFGQAQKLVTEKSRKKQEYPAVHIRKGRYQNVFPDNCLGNFSFFILEDPQTVDFKPHANNTVKSKYAVVFWVNLDAIFGKHTDRNKEAVKAEILEVFTRKMFLSFGRADVKQIYEKAENIYKGFSIDEICSQFLMQPYCGFRFEGDMTLAEPC